MSRLIRQYQKAQRDVRDLYDPFTDSHCPTCETPCCRKPVRVDSVDIALAKGKKLHDKRESIKDRDWNREKSRLMRDKG